MSDYANLARAGIEPLGIVAWTSVFFAAYENNWITEPNLLQPRSELRAEGVHLSSISRK